MVELESQPGPCEVPGWLGLLKGLCWGAESQPLILWLCKGPEAGILKVVAD